MSDPRFNAALEAALTVDRDLGVVTRLGATVVVLGLYGALVVMEPSLARLFLLAFLVVVVGLGVDWWAFLTKRTPGLKKLRALRGAELAHWFASPSHGLLALTDTSLLGGKGLEGSFRPGAVWAVNSASYDEDRHTLTVLLRGATSEEGKLDPTRRFVVAMDPSLSKEQGFDFARLINRRVAGT